MKIMEVDFNESDRIGFIVHELKRKGIFMTPEQVYSKVREAKLNSNLSAEQLLTEC